MLRVNGEVDGVRQSILSVLDSLYDVRMPQNQLWTLELLETLAEVTAFIGRELAVYSDRKGHITDVRIGNNGTVALGVIEGRRGGGRLSGVRCIHTHPESSGRLSAMDISSQKQLRLDAMVAVGVMDGKPVDIHVGVPSPANPDETDILGPYTADKEDFNALLEYIDDAEKTLRETMDDIADGAERVILVGIQKPDDRQLNGFSEADVSMAELGELAKTAGAMVVGKMMQNKDRKSAATYIGQGKLEELHMSVQVLEADAVIFDEELSGAQQRNIEAVVGVKVLDRTGLILDIFAQHARSREGILQVELAQLEYRLPRLTGLGTTMSRLGAGIGTRGPGESKLETDRRHIRSRMNVLKQQLEDIKRQRGVLRSDRKKGGLPIISIVGYTNAGKSTLLNTLTKSDVLVEDKLFATLDTTTRKYTFANGGIALLTDTVGFIRKLPHHLLDAFKSTLEEVVLSDLILIVADASDPQTEDHIRIVDEILAELGAGEKPVVIALNKSDKIDATHPLPLVHDDRPMIPISATTGAGLQALAEALQDRVFENRVRSWFLFPYAEGALLGWLHENGKIYQTDYVEEGTLVDAELEKSVLGHVAKFQTKKHSEAL